MVRYFYIFRHLYEMGPTVLSLERMCCFKKLKGCVFLTTIVLFTIWFVMLTFSSNENSLIGRNQNKEITKQQLSYPRWEKNNKSVNLSEGKPLVKNVSVGQNASNSTLQRNGTNSEPNKNRVKQNATFLESIQPSKIPLNRSAFGEKYTLNETRSNIYDFPYIINGSGVCQKIKNPFLVIMILSVHTHIDTRTAIRNTWGRASNPGVWPRHGPLKQKVSLVFLFGSTKNHLANKIVAEESKMYGDIVQADFVDSYFNLTYKTVMGLRWVAEHCPGAKYILKADEDVFVHVLNLIMFLLKQKPNQRVVYGHTLYNSDVFREGRWGVSMRAYPLPVYPTYTCGNTYVISGALAADMYYTAGLLPYLNIEDVFVTGVLRIFVKADVMDVIGFTHWFEKKPLPCEFINQIRISATKVVDYMQYGLFEALKSQKVQNCYKVVRVIHVNAQRPERRMIEQQLMRDDHIYYNETSGLYYIL